MTAEALVKARAAKREADKVRRANAREENAAFREWLVRERKAFEQRVHIENVKGRDDTEWLIADMCWRDLWMEVPKWHNVSDEQEDE